MLCSRDNLARVETLDDNSSEAATWFTFKLQGHTCEASHPFVDHRLYRLPKTEFKAFSSNAIPRQNRTSRLPIWMSCPTFARLTALWNGHIVYQRRWDTPF